MQSCWTQWFGVKQALGSVEEDSERLAAAVAARSPKLAVLWLGAIWAGDPSGMAKRALFPLQPISIPVASWTELYNPSCKSNTNALSPIDWILFLALGNLAHHIWLNRTH
jgi:hypothetical protein